METDTQALRKELTEWIKTLKETTRFGAMNDDPEGSRYIKISDTLAQSLVESLQGLHILLQATADLDKVMNENTA